MTGIRPTLAALLMCLCACDAEPAARPASAVGQPATPAPALIDVPHPEPGDFKPDVAASLQPAIEKFHQSAGAHGVALGRAYGKLGLHYQAHEQQSAAAACYLNAITLAPEDARWPYYLAVHYEETGDFAAAIETYRRSLEIDPDNTAGATRLGLLYARTGHDKAAARLLTAVRSVMPDNAAAVAGLAALASDKRDYTTAAQLYGHALELQPQASQLHYRLGLVYRQMGEIDKAKQELALRGPRIPRIADPLLLLMQAHTKPVSEYLRLGDAARDRRDLRKAVRMFGLAVAVDASSATGLRKLGEVLLAVNRPDSARQRLEKLVLMEPGNAQNHYLFGLSQIRSGDRESARQSFEHALRLDPEMAAARRALEELR